MKRTESLTYINSRNQNIVLGCTHTSQIWLVDADGLDQLTSSVSTAGGIDQYGETATHKKLNMRSVTVTGKLRSSIDANRSDIIKITNPTLTGKLVYADTSRSITRYLDVMVEESPQFSDSAYPEFDISFLAPYPLWKTGMGNQQSILLTTSGSAKTGTINNIGDLDTGIKFVVVFADDCNTITFTNTTTLYSLTINHNFEAGDRLTVSTGYDNCRATLLNGVQETNVFPKVTTASNWWTLEPGNNAISVTCQNIAAISTCTAFYDIVWLGARR